MRLVSAETKRVIVTVATVTCALALVFAATAVGSARTTGPQHKRYVYLLTNDKTLVFHNVDLTSLTRGSYLRFFLFNEGKKVHQLSVRGIKTPRVKPGGRGQTRWILFNSRGTFSFFDPTDPALHGKVTIL